MSNPNTKQTRAFQPVDVNSFGELPSFMESLKRDIDKGYETFWRKRGVKLKSSGKFHFGNGH